MQVKQQAFREDDMLTELSKPNRKEERVRREEQETSEQVLAVIL